MYITTKSGRRVELPTPEEDAAISAAVLADPDARPLTDAEWALARTRARIGGQPVAAQPKVPTTIPFDADVLAALEATGPGWQARVNDAMRAWLVAGR
jgi:uncharacterized protein (DUF4415 family)